MAKKFKRAALQAPLTEAIAAGATPEEQARRQQIVQTEFGATLAEAVTAKGGVKQFAAAEKQLIGERGALQTKRKLKLRGGQRSTRRSRTSPDLFASSLGATKTLLGS